MQKRRRIFITIVVFFVFIFFDGCFKTNAKAADESLGQSNNTSAPTVLFPTDDDGCPPTERVVVLQLPEDVSTTMMADLLALLREMTDLREEQEGVVDKITTGVSTVYTDLTKKINTAVKGTAPGAHKSTKWLRKGTGSLVRMGGSLVSKGMHLIADQVAPGQPQEEESVVHSYLVDSLSTFRKKLEVNEITYV